MIRKPFILGLAGVAALALVALAGSNAGVQATHTSGYADDFAVDAVTAGNTATSLGTRDNCVAVSAGDSVTLDITITDVPVTTTATGFTYLLLYNATALSVTAADPNQFLASAPGSSLFNADEPLPDTNGQFTAAVADLGPTFSSEESGSGVLERVTLAVSAGAAAGGYPLHLFDAAYSDNVQVSHPPATTFSGQIAVDVTCASLTLAEAPPAIMGDVDCSNTVNAVDALKVLRSNSGLVVAQTEPCNDIGALLPHVGDVDCSGTVNAVDALKILRKNAGLLYTQTEPCDDIGT